MQLAGGKKSVHEFDTRFDTDEAKISDWKARLKILPECGTQRKSNGK